MVSRQTYLWSGTAQLELCQQHRLGTSFLHLHRTDTSTTLRFEDNSGYVGPGTLLADIRVIEIPAAVTTILNNDPTLSYDAATNKFYRLVNSATTWMRCANCGQLGNPQRSVGQLATIRLGLMKTNLIGTSLARSMPMSGSAPATKQRGTWRLARRNRRRRNVLAR
jgi:hypothetical protein